MLENKNLPDLEQELETSFKNGLSSEEAQKRLLRDGENKLEEKKKYDAFIKELTMKYPVKRMNGLKY